MRENLVPKSNKRSLIRTPSATGKLLQNPVAKAVQFYLKLKTSGCLQQEASVWAIPTPHPFWLPFSRITHVHTLHTIANRATIANGRIWQNMALPLSVVGQKKKHPPFVFRRPSTPSLSTPFGSAHTLYAISHFA